MTNTTAVVFTTSTDEGAALLDDALLVECGYMTICEQRGSHDLVNTVGVRLECVDCFYTTSEDYGSPWACCEDCG